MPKIPDKKNPSKTRRERIRFEVIFYQKGRLVAKTIEGILRNILSDYFVATGVPQIHYIPPTQESLFRINKEDIIALNAEATNFSDNEWDICQTAIGSGLANWLDIANIAIELALCDKTGKSPIEIGNEFLVEYLRSHISTDDTPTGLEAAIKLILEILNQEVKSLTSGKHDSFTRLEMTQEILSAVSELQF